MLDSTFVRSITGSNDNAPTIMSAAQSPTIPAIILFISMFDVPIVPSNMSGLMLSASFRVMSVVIVILRVRVVLSPALIVFASVLPLSTSSSLTFAVDS